MKYDDIINLEHFHDPKRPYMSNKARAAQFMPFHNDHGQDLVPDDGDDDA